MSTDWLKAIQDHHVSNIDSVPEGWASSRMIAKQYNKTQRWAMDKLSRMRQDGLVEVKEFVVSVNGIVRPVKHYKYVNKSKSNK